MSEEKKKKKIVEKVLMGAVIGGAIGSVLGASISPKKKTEQPVTIVDEKPKGFFSKVRNVFKRKKKNKDPLKEIPHEFVDKR